MKLSTKPDLEEAVLRWEYFWKGEVYKRPVILAAVPKGEAGQVFGRGRSEDEDFHAFRYYNAVNGLWETQSGLIDRMLERTAFMGEHIPMFAPDFGPDQWAAFFGAEFSFNKESQTTNWVEPVVSDWEDALPLSFNCSNPVFQKLLRYAEFLSERGCERFLVSQIDAHSNADALSALRGPERFLMDLYDFPEHIDRAMQDIRKSYKPVHKAVAEAGKMNGGRGQGHYGFWHKKSFQVVQSDVICMLSPEHFRSLVMPALEEEFSFHEGVYFHLDGPGALRHLDDILSIPGRWILQWLPGAGRKPNWQWTEVLLKGQKAGKAVHVFGEGLGCEEIKSLNAQLDPARVVYSPDLASEADVRHLLESLERAF